MTEYYTVKRIDNSRLVRPPAPAQLREFWRRVLVGAAIAGCLMFYVWQHFECIQLRYKIEQLDVQRSQAAQLNQQLHLEVATLRAPSRVDAIARNRLGLTVSVPGQVMPASGSSETVLAQASPAVQTLQP
ncbi:MAG: cell division protein FtsL [Candidatus Acidiferrales bacterium]